MTSLFAAVQGSLIARSQDPACGDILAEYRFSEDFIGFAGHFPDNPVTPGIALILAVLVATGKTELALHEIRLCKFLRPVLPGELLLMTISLAEHAEGCVARASLSVKGERCAVMHLLLSAAPQENISDAAGVAGSGSV